MPPAAFAARMNSSPSCTVRNTSAAVEPPLRRDAATSRPVIPGIEMSSTMTSGCKAWAASSALFPFLAVPTTTQPSFSTEAARDNIVSLSSTSRTRGSSHDVMLDRILNQFGARLDFELFHHPVFVEGHGPRREIQEVADLLHRMPLGEELQHFPLPRRQLLGRLVDLLERSHHPLGHERRNVRPPLHDFTDRRQ